MSQDTAKIHCKHNPTLKLVNQLIESFNTGDAENEAQNHSSSKQSEPESKHEGTEESDPSTRIETYLKMKKSLRFATIEGISFFRYCIAIIDEDLAIEIVKNGIDLDINEPWDSGQSPLMFAVQMDMIQLIQTIFEHKSKEINLMQITDDFLVQFNDFQCGGKTALHYSAMNGSLEICKILIEFENKVLKSNKLLFIKDFENNNAIDTALIYGKHSIAKYLFSLMNGQTPMSDMNEWIKNREIQLTKKRLKDSKSTRLRFEQQNKDLINAENDLLNKPFVIPKFWNEQICKEILGKVQKFGAKNGWTTQRHRSYATTDIPSFMIGYEIDESIRKLLYNELYPQICEKYKMNERFGIIGSDKLYFDIGVRDLFFVKYDLLKQNELKLHRDGSLVSFNILLNDKSEFEGGGTYFKHLNKVIEIERGDCVMHSGKVLHAGHPIRKGQRFILVGFLDGKVRPKI